MFPVFPPPQLNVVPPVVDDAVNVTLVLVQVSIAGVAILTFGAVMFCVTDSEALVVQPFAGSVTVAV